MHDDSNSSMRAGTPVYLSIKLKRLYREGLECSLVKRPSKRSGKDRS
jgi:hypothetical protein